MKLVSPLSPFSYHSLPYHSADFKKKILIDALIEATAMGESILIAYQDETFLDGLDELSMLSQNSQENVLSFFELVHSINKITESLIQHLEDSNKKLFGEQGFWEMVDMFTRHSNQQADLYNLPDTLETPFTSALYTHYKKKLRIAAPLLDEEVMYVLQQGVVSDNAFISQEDVQRNAPIKYVDSFLNRARRIEQKLAQFLIDYKQVRITEFDAKASKLKTYCELGMAMESYFGLEPKNDLIEKWNSLLQECKILCGDKKETLQNLTVEYVQSELNRLTSFFHHRLEQEVKMLNVRNVHSDDMSNLFIDLTQLIKDVNNSCIFKQETSMNALSLSITLEQLKNMISMLENGKFELDPDRNYSKWMHFVAFLSDDEKEVIESFKKIPKEHWQAVFDQWFLKRMLDQHRMSTQSSVFGMIEQLDMCWEQLRFDFVIHISSLSKKHNSTISFCPLEEVETKERKETVLIYLADQEVVFSSEKAIPFKAVLGLKPKKNNQYDESSILHESLVLPDESTDELNFKLAASKTLATFFIEESDLLDLFLTPEHNVIISSAYEDVVELLSEITAKGKHLHIPQNGFKVLTEFFLNDAQKGYYFYDQSSLKFKDASDIYRHISKIKALQLSGYYTIAIDRTQLHRKDYINELISQHAISLNA